MSIQARADCRAADRKIVKPGQSIFHTFDVPFKQAGPTGHFLTNSQRGRVLQMGPADLHDVFELSRFHVDRVVNVLHFRNQSVHLLSRGNVHRRWKRVVR